MKACLGFRQLGLFKNFMKRKAQINDRVMYLIANEIMKTVHICINGNRLIIWNDKPTGFDAQLEVQLKFFRNFVQPLSG